MSALVSQFFDEAVQLVPVSYYYPIEMERLSAQKAGAEAAAAGKKKGAVGRSKRKQGKGGHTGDFDMPRTVLEMQQLMAAQRGPKAAKTQNKQLTGAKRKRDASSSASTTSSSAPPPSGDAAPLQKKQRKDLPTPRFNASMKPEVSSTAMVPASTKLSAVDEPADVIRSKLEARLRERMNKLSNERVGEDGEFVSKRARRRQEKLKKIMEHGEDEAQRQKKLRKAQKIADAAAVTASSAESKKAKKGEKPVAQQQLEQPPKMAKKKAEKGNQKKAEVSTDFMFGDINVGEKSGKEKAKEQRKQKKTRGKEDAAQIRRLERFEKKVEQVREEKGDEAAKELLHQQAVNAALLRAQGITVKDDKKLLKKGLKKKEKAKKKSSKAWKDRVKAVEKDKAGRQKKRTENIRDRHVKKGKKSKGKR